MGIKIIAGAIALAILGTTLFVLTCMGLYMFWFKALPDFWKMITKKK